MKGFSERRKVSAEHRNCRNNPNKEIITKSWASRGNVRSTRRASSSSSNTGSDASLRSAGRRRNKRSSRRTGRRRRSGTRTATTGTRRSWPRRSSSTSPPLKRFVSHEPPCPPGTTREPPPKYQLPFNSIQKRAALTVDNPILTDRSEPRGLRKEFISLCILYRVFHEEYSEEMFEIIHHPIISSSPSHKPLWPSVTVHKFNLMHWNYT